MHSHCGTADWKSWIPPSDFWDPFAVPPNVQVESTVEPPMIACLNNTPTVEVRELAAPPNPKQARPLLLDENARKLVSARPRCPGVTQMDPS